MNIGSVATTMGGKHAQLMNSSLLESEEAEEVDDRSGLSVCDRSQLLGEDGGLG